MSVIEEILIPKESVNDEEVLIKNIDVQNGEKVTNDTLILDYESSKASFEIYSQNAGYVKLFVNIGDIVKIGEKVAELYDEPLNVEMQEDHVTNSVPEVLFTKKAKEKIIELKMDEVIFASYTSVKESDVINEYDLMNKYSSVDKPSPIKMEEIKNLFDRNRNLMVSAVNKRIDTVLLDLDKEIKGVELKGSLLPFLIKVVSKIFEKQEEYSHLNGFTDGELIYRYKHINAGIALNFGDGLRLGVIKNSNKKTISEIEGNLLSLIDKYIEGKLLLDDVTGATYAITVLTDQNIDSFIPLIKNENAIMIGLSGNKGKKQNITVAFDHRITDGLQVSKFINEIVDTIFADYKGIFEDVMCYRCMKTLDETKGFNLEGLLKIVDIDGNEKYICETCLDGY